MRKDYAFAELPDDALRELTKLEARLREELGEPITLIAYEELFENSSTACRADLEGE